MEKFIFITPILFIQLNMFYHLTVTNTFIFFSTIIARHNLKGMLLRSNPQPIKMPPFIFHPIRSELLEITKTLKSKPQKGCSSSLELKAFSHHNLIWISNNITRMRSFLRTALEI